MSITQQQITGILDRIQHHIETRFFNPLADIANWTKAWKEQREWLLASASAAEFEQRVNAVLATLKSSHVAFFHVSGNRVPAPYALNATFLKAEEPEPQWLFLDVLEGGVAHKSGIEPDDVLLSVNSARIVPPEVLRFDLGASTEILVRSRDGAERSIAIALPPPTTKGRPPMVKGRRSAPVSSPPTSGTCGLPTSLGMPATVSRLPMSRHSPLSVRARGSSSTFEATSAAASDHCER